MNGGLVHLFPIFGSHSAALVTVTVTVTTAASIFERRFGHCNRFIPRATQPPNGPNRFLNADTSATASGIIYGLHLFCIYL